ncbi:small glutamine-rich tetratricopeptide repeat-containing protein beta [Histomonas meleagridis]|uniref:small glutamine-rich tetratricopeptide repeat-containing protein beta n=1 Tax=Histomonas meleagridis TaxID=135588 RepID=UPI0035597620|nr:small glutamine-rich tetratricopeptide repeat-containing protein beta [Histomonas meleagridis]KAH0804419.1 small glutamine-rich tetratricopeptide repeat-containing protein beta [Histomonas meleagridis]
MSGKHKTARCLILQYLESCSQEDKDHRDELEVAIDCLKNIWGIENSSISIPGVSSILDLVPDSGYDTEKANALKLEGNDLLRAGKFQEAISKYTEAIDVDPTQSAYYCNRAAVYSKINQHEKAITDCEKAIQLTPDYATAYSRLGYAYYSMGQTEKAREAYKRGLRACPNNQNLKDNLESLGPEIPNPQPQGGQDFLSGLMNNPMFAQLGQKLQSPEVQALLQEPEMQDLYEKIQANPAAIMSYLGDPRMQRLMGLIMGGN